MHDKRRRNMIKLFVNDDELTLTLTIHNKSLTELPGLLNDINILLRDKNGVYKSTFTPTPTPTSTPTSECESDSTCVCSSDEIQWGIYLTESPKKKIEYIKLIRNLSGCSLRDAKTILEESIANRAMPFLIVANFDEGEKVQEIFYKHTREFVNLRYTEKKSLKCNLCVYVNSKTLPIQYNDALDIKYV